MKTRPLQPAQRFTVAVIGGGFTGTTLAVQWVRHTDPSFSVVVIERMGLPGRGVAYGTACESHLLNVPAKDMSAFAQYPEHFLSWAKSNYDREVRPGAFLPRKEYGRYLGSILSAAIQSTGKGRLRWKKDDALAVSRLRNGDIEIRLRSGDRILADKVVLALGNFPASDPPLPGRNLPRRPHSLPDPYFSNPWSGTNFDGVEHLDSILLLGSGLSSVDVALELRHRGFPGTIHMLSRHGLLPHAHQAHGSWPIFWNERSPQDVRGLLRLVRDEVREAERQGIDWRGVINCLREVTPRIWQSLPEAERRRFLRHVRPYWEVHRHRAAPEIAQFIDAQRSNGQIKLHAGRITNYREKGSRVEITCRDRKSGAETCLSINRIINCTAPETDSRRLSDALLTTLIAQGLVRPDPLFLGLDASADGALIDRDGVVSDSLYTVGLARKGSLWESTAIPEIRQQVYQLVQLLIKRSETTHTIGLDPRREESCQATSV